MKIQTKPDLVFNEEEQPKFTKGTRIFYDKLIDTHFNLSIFLHNLKTLEYRKATIDELSDKHNICEYRFDSNEILYTKNYFKSGITHELLHASSSIRKGKYIYSGFMQLNTETSEVVAFGLCEAYTTILDERYFGDVYTEEKKIVEKAYVLARYFVDSLEAVVGNDVMEKLYSECNLAGLTKILSKFTSYKSTLKFYSCLDYMVANCFTSSKGMIRCVNYAVRYITILHYSVMSHLYEENCITKEEYDQFMEALQSQVKKPIIIGRYLKRKSKIIGDSEFAKIKSLKKNT